MQPSQMFEDGDLGRAAAEPPFGHELAVARERAGRARAVESAARTVIAACAVCESGLSEPLIPRATARWLCATLTARHDPLEAADRVGVDSRAYFVAFYPAGQQILSCACGSLRTAQTPLGTSTVGQIFRRSRSSGFLLLSGIKKRVSPRFSQVEFGLFRAAAMAG